MCSSLDELNRGASPRQSRLAALHPFRKLKRQQFAEQWADTHAGKVIPCFADKLSVGFVITILGMIQRQVHETGKRDEAFPFDLRADDLSERVHSHCRADNAGSYSDRLAS